MDEICIWLERLAQWVSHVPVLPIDYIGLGREAIRNPPFPLLEICYAVNGSFPDLRIGDRQVALRAQHVSLHSVNFGNRGTGTRGARCWCLFFDITGQDEFREFLAQPQFLELAVHQHQRLSAAFETAAIRCRMPKVTKRPYSMAEGDRQGRFSSWSVKAAILEVLAILIEEAGGEEQPSREPEAVRLAREFIARHYADPQLGLRAIAAAACLSPAHFCRVFREYTGTTAMHYLQAIRLEQSRYLLERSGRRVNEVAQEVGFRDPLHFSRVFRQVLGVSPAAYRRRHQRP